MTLLGVVGISVLWSLPQALMSAELSLMMEVNGGNVVWVQRAFGDFLGFVNAHATVWNNIASQALLIDLFVEYIPYTFVWYEEWGK